MICAASARRWPAPDSGSCGSTRQGDYRIVVSIEDDVVQILVVKIGHRREVYRR